MKLAIAFLLSVTLYTVSNSEIQSRERALDVEEEGVLVVDRFPLPDISAHSIQKRQSPLCMDQTDCIPSSLPGVTVPADLIFCQSGSCVCRQCFELNITDNRCIELTPCQTYNRGTLSCDDARRSQLVAMLLSLFLSEVGAANFYIARNDLAGGQLAIFLMSFLVICIASCPCCFLCCCKDDSGERSAVGLCLYIVAIVIGVVIALICAFMMVAWWIADLVIFVQNTRVDGQNCMLRVDL